MAARISRLHLYPLKSGASIDVKTAKVESDGLWGDRRMMVVDENGACLTSRRFPDLLKLHCSFEGDMIVLSARGMDAVAFSRSALDVSPYLAATIWGEDIEVLDAGDAVAKRLSDFIGHPCRLVLQGARTVRPLPERPGTVNLADTAPLLLIGTASLAELNLHLDTPVEMARFRPNIVIEGVEPFDEDQWATLRIGEVEFETMGPCDRCMVTTLDPESGNVRADNEPLATLSKRRRGEDGKPYFGQFLQPRSTGRIHAGDPVTILSRKPPPKLHPAPPSTHIIKASSPGRRGDGPLDLTCTAIIEETADISTYRFKVEGGAWANYQPGQFLTLLLDIDGQSFRRNYTISSSPTRPHHLSITVKRVEDGRVSNWLHNTLRPGMALKAAAPNGRFHLGATGGATRLLMLSAGSGITPMISMLRAIADLDLPHDVVFHHSCRRETDMPFREELQALSRQMPGRLTVSWTITGNVLARPVSADPGLYRGRLDANMLSSICADIAGRTTLCCGPDGFRAAARALHAEQAPSAAFLEESFGAAADERAADKPEPYRVGFRKSGRTAEGTGTETLLDLARAHGIAIRSDCEAGICGACRCRVIEGRWMLSGRCVDPDRLALSEEEKAENYVLACTTRPLGSVLVDL